MKQYYDALNNPKPIWLRLRDRLRDTPYTRELKEEIRSWEEACIKLLDRNAEVHSEFSVSLAVNILQAIIIVVILFL